MKIESAQHMVSTSMQDSTPKASKHPDLSIHSIGFQGYKKRISEKMVRSFHFTSERKRSFSTVPPTLLVQFVMQYLSFMLQPHDFVQKNMWNFSTCGDPNNCLEPLLIFFELTENHFSKSSIFFMKKHQKSIVRVT